MERTTSLSLSSFKSLDGGSLESSLEQSSCCDSPSRKERTSRAENCSHGLSPGEKEPTFTSHALKSVDDYPLAKSPSADSPNGGKCESAHVSSSPKEPIVIQDVGQTNLTNLNAREIGKVSDRDGNAGGHNTSTKLDSIFSKKSGELGFDDVAKERSAVVKKWRRPGHDDAAKEWNAVEEMVQRLKDILRSFKPEQMVKNADDHKLLAKALSHHPKHASKVGCGIDYFKVALANDYGPTKCFFVVRTDGTQEDFSYHKCLITMTSKMNPAVKDLYVETYIKNSNNIHKWLRDLKLGE